MKQNKTLTQMLESFINGDRMAAANHVKTYMSKRAAQLINEDENVTKMKSAGNVPAELADEFDGGKQVDWIIYDKQLKNMFCIAIWTEPNDPSKWVLGEYVAIVNDNAKVFAAMNNGYMTMLEAAKLRDQYDYIIADHKFDMVKEVFKNAYWQLLVPNLSEKVYMASPNTPIVLDEFLEAMKKLAPANSVHWTNSNWALDKTN